MHRLIQKTLNEKLNRIRNGKYNESQFIIADAKDSDMGGGLTAFGYAGSVRSLRTFNDHLDAIRQMTKSEAVDIMLMSASAAAPLVEEGLFDSSPVTPAVRLNDATDIWGMRHSSYRLHPPRDFRSARIDRIRKLVKLGLYSITFSNDLQSDLAFLNSFHRFLDDINGTGVQYFLEVFNPQIDIGIGSEDIPDFVNDCITRTLAGLTTEDFPQFLKIPFNGPKAMEELCSYDPQRLIVGVLGGSAGTTRDTLELVRQSAKFGAKVALFGRKILQSEAPHELVRTMRLVVESGVKCEDAVRWYHGYLTNQNIMPNRTLEDDLTITEEVLKQDL